MSETQFNHFKITSVSQNFIYAGADGYNVPDFVCDIYFDGKKPCFGGVQVCKKIKFYMLSSLQATASWGLC